MIFFLRIQILDQGLEKKYHTVFADPFLSISLLFFFFLLTMSEQEGQDSSSNSSGYPSSSSWPNQSSLQSPRHTVSINSAATSFSNPSSRLTAAESHGGSNFGSSSSSSSVGGGEMQHEGLTASLSCSSSGFATASNSLASAQARVSMACTHCRQRKIRCDGQQPTCSTCFRLGRYCVYESISE